MMINALNEFLVIISDVPYGVMDYGVLEWSTFLLSSGGFSLEKEKKES